jgi:hypothetical protein
MTHHTDWPASPLQAAGRAFDLLTTPPTPHVFDGTGFPGLPDRDLDLPTLRRILMAAATTPPQRDAVWRELVARSLQGGEDGRTWTVLAVGVALPGLTRIAGTLARGCRGDTADLDAEVVAGFLLRLATLDTTGQRVLGRLLDAATRAGRRARAENGDHLIVRIDEAWPAAPAQPWGHPDCVLARAVAAGVLDRTEARLIGATRLEDITIADAAAYLDIDPHLALTWRRQAETRLADAIQTGELDHLRVTPSGRDPAAVRRAFARAARARRHGPAPVIVPVISRVAPATARP